MIGTRVFIFLGIGVFLLGAAGRMFGAEPETIEQAIAAVKAVTDPDPIKQDRQRAEKALKIVQARVKVINDLSGTFLQTIPIDVWNQAFGEPTILDRAKVLDAARAKGWDLARAAWTIKGGACDEHASLMKMILQSAGVANVKIMRSNSPHAFPVVNIAADADPDIPWTWGKDAFIPDSWAGEVVSPVDSWDKRLYFAGGKCFVSPGASLSTREKLEKMVVKGNDYLKQHCDVYKELLTRFAKIPAGVRDQMSFQPPRNVCTSCGNISGAWIGELEVTGVSGPSSIEKGQTRHVRGGSFTVAQKDCDVSLRFNTNEIIGTMENDVAVLSKPVTGSLVEVKLTLENGKLRVVLKQGSGATVITSEGLFSQ